MSEETGSAKLLSNLGRPNTFKEADLKRFVASVEKYAKLTDWRCKGQPHPDLVRGAFQVPIRDVGRALQALVANGGFRIVIDEGFPIGFPEPEAFQLGFTLGR